MANYREKLGILSEMISFARADDSIKESEFNFLLGVSKQLGISRRDFDALLDEGVNTLMPKTQLDRIVQFHRLVLLMNVDHESHPDEIRQLKDTGLHMGLPPTAIDQVLTIMHQYPDKIVPPEVLMDIFRAHYN
ncbi:TerB family tellurite resistance protein [Robiginitalea sp. M366]|uniref:TerB family tellurite resistance protein n=1 Tax=Robiginitalea aestuariiviva TaxID=3036903 RepID=UPI00240D5153|nr:TerB family tellurite resistance protein [Robiginitalea aestuariiviva]MDG1572351.1 TerB family tellurite resistance protein [Robiginitalea aestuariiviva]